MFAHDWNVLQDIAYEFTDQDIKEVKDAVAAVEAKGLKVR
jgi:hypothetical protein